MMDIPSDAFPALLELAGKGKSAKITGVSVDKSIFGFNSDPDYLAIRLKVRSWIQKAEADSERALAQATASPSPNPSGSPTTRPKPAKSTPTPGAANSIETTCRYK